MAKQCPSKPTPSLFRRNTSARAWERRIFKSTYVRGGIRRQVQAWAVKIQFQGLRKTFSLKAGNRREAALEARQIYDRVWAQGWGPVLEWLRGQKSPQGLPSAENGASKDAPAY